MRDPNRPWLAIDFETGDKITVCNLKDAYDYMKSENIEFEEKIKTNGQLEEHEKGDMVYNITMMTHIREVLKYYGETV